MMPLVASDAVQGTLETTDDAGLLLASGYAHSANEYMPQIRHVLGLHELSTAQECDDYLAKLRTHFDAVDGNPEATHEGIYLGDYLRGLRNLVSAPIGMTWDEVFEVIEDLIDSALDESESDDDGEVPASANQTTTAAIAAEPEETIMSEEKTAAAALSDTQAKLASTTVLLSDAQAKVTASENKLSELTLKLSAAQSSNTTLETENAALKKQIEERDLRELETEVDDAIRVYADSKGAKPEMRPHLLNWAKSDRAGFRAY
jgi:hypothetical protein